MRGIFLRIYLTFVAGMVVAAVGAGIITVLVLGAQRTGFFDARMRGLTRQLGLRFGPGDLAEALQRGDAATLGRVVDDIAADVHMGLVVFDARGRRYGSRPRNPEPPPEDAMDRLRSGEVVIKHRPGRLCAYAPVVVRGELKGIVAVYPFAGATAGELLRPAIWLFAFLVGLALLTWPVARGMSRRLERLTDGARAIAAGRLDTRVAVAGRDEIAVLGRAMDDMAERLARLMRGQKELVASVSHELRSPLARLKVSLEMAGDDALDPEQRQRHLREVAADIQDLEGLVDDLLLASRLELADFPLRPEPVDLSRLAVEAAGRYSGVDVDAPEPVALVADAKLLRRVLVNLVENARRAAPEGAAVHVRVRAEGEGAAVCVCDEGPGVPVDQRERIFEPFVRLDPSRSRESGGAGLGLAIARRIVRRHGGDVSVAEAEGGGAEFRVVLPGKPPDRVTMP